MKLPRALPSSLPDLSHQKLTARGSPTTRPSVHFRHLHFLPFKSEDDKTLEKDFACFASRFAAVLKRIRVFISKFFIGLPTKLTPAQQVKLEEMEKEYQELVRGRIISAPARLRAGASQFLYKSL